MVKFIIIGIIIIIPILLIKFKVLINFKSFLSKGFRPKRSGFGIYCFNGGQGSGKTTSLCSFLYDHKDNIFVFSNIHSINIKGLPIIYFTGLRELNLWKDRLDTNYNNLWSQIGQKQVIFVYDELFQELTKGTKLDKPTIDFLSQMRKRKIIFLTTCQYWSELPISLRRFVRFQIDCKMIPLIISGLLIQRYRDGENMKWSNDDQDFVAPLVKTCIEKTRINVVNSFNTFEKIKSDSSSSER